MRHSTRVLTALLLGLPLAAGCSEATRDQRVGRTPSTTPPTTLTSTNPDIPAPIPGHPPITTSGVVAHYTPSRGLLTFQDGRVVQLTNATTIAGKGDPRALAAGDKVVVDNVLPVGVLSILPSPGTTPDHAKMSDARMRQRMATVATIDEPNGWVRMTDGSIVRVVPATKMHMGMAGPTLVLTDLQPGDELVFIIGEAGTTEGASPSALPRQTTAAPTPIEASEIMIFRVQPAR